MLTTNEVELLELLCDPLLTEAEVAWWYRAGMENEAGEDCSSPASHALPNPALPDRAEARPDLPHRAEPNRAMSGQSSTGPGCESISVAITTPPDDPEPAGVGAVPACAGAADPFALLLAALRLPDGDDGVEDVL